MVRRRGWREQREVVVVVVLFRVGKIIASFFAIFAISFFALPAVRTSQEVLAESSFSCSQRAFWARDSPWKFNRNNGKSTSRDKSQQQQHWSRQRGVFMPVPRTHRAMRHGTSICTLMTRNSPAPHLRRVTRIFQTIIKHLAVNEKTILTVTFDCRRFSLEKTAEKLRYLRLPTSGRKSRSKRASQMPSPNLLQAPSIHECRSPPPSASNTTGRETRKATWSDLRSRSLSLSLRNLSAAQSWTWRWRFRRGTDQIILVSSQWSRDSLKQKSQHSFTM